MSEQSFTPRASIERHSKSFALASRLLPERAAHGAALVYAWCRRADDAIDESSAESPAQALGRLRRELDAVYTGAPSPDPVLSAFRSVVRASSIPRKYPADLLDGMEMDVAGQAYATLDDLLVYCYRVASTVGLMMCHVMGVSDGVALRHAAHLGLGMQLTNICRDVHEDFRRGRLYLPDEALARHGAGGLRTDLGGPFPASALGACRGTLQELLAVADRYYASSDLGLEYLSWRCALAVNAARRIYSAIGSQVARQGWDVLGPRAVVPTSYKLGLCAQAALSTLSQRWWRLRPGFAAVSLQTVQHETELIPL
jgi:15-cis-phytoene synthase